MKFKKIVTHILLISIVVGTLPTSVNAIVIDKEKYNKIDVVKNLSNNDYEYQITEEGVKITKYLGNEERVIIPDYIDGKKVIAIDSWAFWKHNNLKSLVVGRWVTNIDGFAFSECENIEELTIPDNINYINIGCEISKLIVPATVTYISDSYFTSSLKEIIVDENNKNYSAENGALYNKDKTKLIKYLESNTNESFKVPECTKEINSRAFEFCKNLKKIDLGRGVEIIGDDAFFNSSIEEVKVPDDVKDIGYFSFAQCSNMKKLIIPSSVKKINKEFYMYVDSLEEIEVDENNENYSSENGVLYNKDKTILIKYPKEKSEEEYKMPNSVEKIEEGALNSKFKRLVMGRKVSSIERAGLLKCKNLQEITISDDLKDVDDYSFPESLRKIIIPPTALNINSNVYNFHLLEDIEVDENNENYSSEDGVLFNKDKTKLIKYPNSKKETIYKISDNVKEISEKAFKGCVLETIIMGRNVESVGYEAFNNNTLKELYLSDNLEVTNEIFNYEEKKLEKIVVPKTVTKIDSYFYNFASVKKIEVDKNNENYSSEDNILYNKDKTKIIKYLYTEDKEKYVIPNNVREIGEKAFVGSRLKEVVIGNSVISIGESAFENNIYLKELKFSNSVEIIEKNAFKNCASLEKIILPSNIKKIEDYAFIDCENLKCAYILGSNTSLGEDVFRCYHYFPYHMSIYGEVYSKAHEYALSHYIKFDISPNKSWYAPGIKDDDRNFICTYGSAKYLKNGLLVKRDNEKIDEYYRFSGKSNSEVSIKFTFPQGKIDYYDERNSLNLYLQDKNGENLASIEDVHPWESKKLNYVLPKSDVYYVVVNGDVGKYDIEVSGIDDDIDTDGDGLYDSQEYYHLTDLLLKDSDNDGIDDYKEIKMGRNPLEKEKIESPEIISFLTDKSSPQFIGTSIELSANAVGTGNLQYKFLVTDNRGNWYKIKDFGESNTCTWKAGAIGNKTLYVDVKDELGQVVRKSMNYIIKEKTPIVSSFTVDKESPQTSGTKVTLKTVATGNGILQYKFIIRNNDNGNWYKIRDFEISNIATWTTGLPGNKTLYVDVKDSTGKVVRKEMAYTVK